MVMNYSTTLDGLASDRLISLRIDDDRTSRFLSMHVPSLFSVFGSASPEPREMLQIIFVDPELSIGGQELCTYQVGREDPSFRILTFGHLSEGSNEDARRGVPQRVRWSPKGRRHQIAIYTIALWNRAVLLRPVFAGQVDCLLAKRHRRR